MTEYSSTDDRRATESCPQDSKTGSMAGGAFRAKYRTLTDAEKDLIDRIKNKAEEFYAIMAEAYINRHDANLPFPLSGGTKLGSCLATPPERWPIEDRNIDEAFRHLEDATYRVVKFITG